MTMKIQFVLAVAVSHVLYLTFVTVSSAAIEGEEHNAIMGDNNYPMTMQFIGVADGKSYFAEVNQTMNRTAAAAHCEASRLKLASIETQAQADLLTTVMPDLGYGNQWYWTSGKESRQDSMFIWNETKAQVNSSLVRGIWAMTNGAYYCIRLNIESPTTQLVAVPCISEEHPLCQT